MTIDAVRKTFGMCSSPSLELDELDVPGRMDELPAHDVVAGNIEQNIAVGRRDDEHDRHGRVRPDAVLVDEDLDPAFAVVPDSRRLFRRYPDSGRRLDDVARPRLLEADGPARPLEPVIAFLLRRELLDGATLLVRLHRRLEHFLLLVPSRHEHPRMLPGLLRRRKDSLARANGLELLPAHLDALRIAPDFLPLFARDLERSGGLHRLIVRIDCAELDLDSIARPVQPVLRPRLGEIRRARHADRALGPDLAARGVGHPRFDSILEVLAAGRRRVECQLRAAGRVGRERRTLHDRLAPTVGAAIASLVVRLLEVPGVRALRNQVR